MLDLAHPPARPIKAPAAPTPPRSTLAAACGIILLASLAACGDDDGADSDASTADASTTPDATPGPDAPTPDAGPLMTDECPSSYGPTGVSMSFSIPPSDVGFDLDGDGDVDNNLGSNSVVREQINNDFGASLANGSLLTLSELRDFDGFGTDDASVMLVMYGGVDSDMPRDHSDDFNGDESFYFSHEWVRSTDCAPKALASATYTGGTLVADADRISFFVDSLGGFIELARPHVEADIEAGTVGQKTVDGSPAVIGGAVVGCSLAQADGIIGANAQVTLLVLGIQPDIDLDDDGVEEIVGDINGIEKCIDGDGTEIVGDLCGCDPRIKDGYSITFLTDLVGATLLGPVP